LKQETVENIQANNEAVCELIRRIGSGDRTALGALYDKTSRLLFGLVLKIVEDRISAEEALLEVYTYVWRQAAFYNSKTLPPIEWLIMVARSRAIANTHWGKKYKRKQLLLEGSADATMSVAPEQQKRARDSISSLISAQREILDWTFYSGLSCSEIAAQTGKPIGAVKTHARLGLSKLEELFSLTFKNEPDNSHKLGD
jgi:RNA polymerase sigma-70 factor, ECF subfamily